jgi:hypothetical protein
MEGVSIKQETKVASIGQHIGFEAGEEMVKRFYDRHPDIAYANVVGREILEKILAQPNCEGIAILPGYNDQGVRQSVLVAVDEHNKPILQYKMVSASGEILSKEGIVADRTATAIWGEDI